MHSFICFNILSTRNFVILVCRYNQTSSNITLTLSWKHTLSFLLNLQHFIQIRGFLLEKFSLSLTETLKFLRVFLLLCYTYPIDPVLYHPNLIVSLLVHSLIRNFYYHAITLSFYQFSADVRLYLAERSLSSLFFLLTTSCRGISLRFGWAWLGRLRHRRLTWSRAKRLESLALFLRPLQTQLTLGLMDAQLTSHCPRLPRIMMHHFWGQ